ncbi:MAG: hypothetical protein FWH18_04575 [Marinilabiliaceae bacterium]|nr:hypothetical protein [Marinilabiliaceae bacterium]
MLGNPEKDEFDHTIAGVLLYHSSDKRELAYRDKPLLRLFKKKSLFYNRVIVELTNILLCWLMVCLTTLSFS